MAVSSRGRGRPDFGWVSQGLDFCFIVLDAPDDVDALTVVFLSTVGSSKPVKLGRILESSGVVVRIWHRFLSDDHELKFLALEFRRHHEPSHGIYPCDDAVHARG